MREWIPQAWAEAAEAATALTYKLTPNEKECFYTHVAKEGSKVAFYFAVQSGGSFDSMLHWQHAFT